MRLIDIIKLAWNNITNRKLRSWLTLLGIVIGVAAVIAIVSISQNATESMNMQMSKFGADIITLSPGFSKADFMGTGKPEGPGGEMDIGSSKVLADDEEDPILTNKDLTIIRGNPDILYAAGQNSERFEMQSGSEKLTVSVTGVDPQYFSMLYDVALDQGRFLTNTDTKNIIISYNLANNTFKKPITIGQQITLEESIFNVVGITTDDGTKSNAVYATNSGFWLISTETNKNEYARILAQVSDADIIDSIITTLTKSLAISRGVYGKKEYDFSISSTKAMQERISTMTDTLSLFLGGIALISLIVGAIGVANSMFTSVLEKTKEIGILKALGATNFEIIKLFLLESGLFGLLGGFIGIILGWMVSSLMAGYINLGRMTFSGTVSLDLIIYAIIISTLIGIIAGLLPAISASKLKPVEALRYE